MELSNALDNQSKLFRYWHLQQSEVGTSENQYPEQELLL